MESIILLGAGFNCDVSSEITIKDPFIRNDYGAYPLIHNLKNICGYNQDSNFEEQLSIDIKRRNDKPLENLCDKIMGTDYYLIPTLLNSNGVYSKFFEKYQSNLFLTFNYDALAEKFLMELGHWNPRDGYGVPVKVEPLKGKAKQAEIIHPNSSKVIHLHGTFCLYVSDYIVDSDQMIQDRDPPFFIFDPDSVSNLFPLYRRCHPDSGYLLPHQRVIAPIPDKSEGLKNIFITEMYKTATTIIKEIGKIIVIGYSFNEHDKISYNPLIQALSEADSPTMLLISPDADRICAKIKPDITKKGIQLAHKNQTFKEWVDEGMNEDF